MTSRSSGGATKWADNDMQSSLSGRVPSMQTSEAIITMNYIKRFLLIPKITKSYVD